MNEEYLYVLDYSTGNVYRIDISQEDQEDELDMDVFLGEYGLNSDECAWMFSSNKIVMIDKIEKLNQ